MKQIIFFLSAILLLTGCAQSVHPKFNTPVKCVKSDDKYIVTTLGGTWYEADRCPQTHSVTDMRDELYKLTVNPTNIQLVKTPYTWEFSTRLPLTVQLYEYSCFMQGYIRVGGVTEKMTLELKPYLFMASDSTVFPDTKEGNKQMYDALIKAITESKAQQ